MLYPCNVYARFTHMGARSPPILHQTRRVCAVRKATLPRMSSFSDSVAGATPIQLFKQRSKTPDNIEIVYYTALHIEQINLISFINWNSFHIKQTVKFIPAEGNYVLSRREYAKGQEKTKEEREEYIRDPFSFKSSDTETFLKIWSSVHINDFQR